MALSDPLSYLTEMLRITASASSAGAKTYYTQALSREDYYSEGHEIVGRWGGKAAERLGLAGTVGREAFFALCDNRDPTSDEMLTARQKANRRVGYDFTFNAPKSVSLLHAFTGDPRIVEAFRAAIQDTMREIETEMKTRVRKDGAQGNRTTGNMLWAEFVHFTGRPVDGLPDPNLHAHCFALNATFDPKERRWKAGEFSDLMLDRPYFEAAFHARLAAHIRQLGYGIERHGKWWDIAGIPRQLVEKFSRRTAEIEAKAAELGITDADAKAALGAKTRQRKDTALSKPELVAEWKSRLTPAEAEALHRVITEAANGGGGVVEPISPSQAMAHAVNVAFERASVVSDKQLREAALRRGAGCVLPKELAHVASAAGVLTRQIDGRQLVTTREVLAEEQAMLAFAREGRGTCKPLATGRPEPSAFLNRDQRAAVTHALTSSDRVILIAGGAGTGKTTLMQEIKAGVEAGGRQLLAFAPTAEASRGVLRAEGFEGAETVARLLADQRLQERVRGQVILIDEAGLLGVRTLRQVFAVAEQTGARVILAGDIRQHGAVERGDALRLLIDKAGLRPAAVQEIMRQRGDYRDAVAALARGDLEHGFARLEAMGCVREIGDAERHQALARNYLAAVKAGKSALVVSPTHAEGDQVTAIVREAMKGHGALGPYDQSFAALRNLAWTEAERADPAMYRPGMVVQLFRDAPGLKRGERLEVEGRDEQGHVIARRRDGSNVQLPTEHAARFQVFAPYRLDLAAGDRVRITQNGITDDGHKLTNGSLYTVKGLTPAGDVMLDNGWRLGRDFGHLAHGYCTTSHASQGKTVDQVFIAQGAASFPASSREQFYVSVSRGRESVRIYTDDKAALRQRIRASSERGSATELLTGGLERHAKPHGLRHGVREVAERARRFAEYTRHRALHLAGTLHERLSGAHAAAMERWLGRGDPYAQPDLAR